MNTPFDAVIASIAATRYHNHRLETHSDIVSDGIVADLRARCAKFRGDLESGRVRIWKHVGSPGTAPGSLRTSQQGHLQHSDEGFGKC